MGETEAAALRRELSELSRRVLRLERRIDSLEPETVPGVGDAAPNGGESAVLDLLGDAMQALGFGGEQRGATGR